MPESENLFVGRKALEEGLVVPEHLVECLIDYADERRARDGHIAPRTLGQLMVARGYLRREDLQRILALRDRSCADAADVEVARIIVERGFASKELVDDALRLQREAPGRHVGEILLERGNITAAQLHEALSSLQRFNYACPGCGARFNVPYAQPWGRYSCRKCGALLEPAGPDASVTGRPEVIRPPETERALAIYLRQKNLVRREFIREAEQIQQEACAYGLNVHLLDILMRRKQITWQQHDALRKVDLSAAVSSEEWGCQVVPGYKVLAKVATGGFAAIFAAEPFFGGERVALKVLLRDRAGEPGAVEFFRREARLMMLLDHPHIVRAYEYGEHQGIHYFTMEFVEGWPLDQAVRERGGLIPALALRITRQVAEALLYMQREGYIHRDVKPENILINSAGIAKLCDLGFAAEFRTRPVLRARDVPLGTAAYVSPEQARGEVDLKVGTDIYSLGLTLYFMLTARVPFDGADNEVIMAERFADGVASPDFSLLEAPEPLVAIVKKMLHPEREKRFTTYVELLEALDGVRI